jgi:multidrug efflux pump subunit AcrA (membrane-fusion protein)
MDTSAVPAVAKKVYIKTGEGGNNQVVITSGLSEGTQLIVKGALGLTTGDPIEVVDNRTENND